MTSEKVEPTRSADKRLADALRVADWRRNRRGSRRYLRAVAPVGHHEAELRTRPSKPGASSAGGRLWRHEQRGE